MVAKPHRQNSDFQLRYFLANGCHTADGAWSLMYNQKIDMDTKLKSSEVHLLRMKAKRMELNFILENNHANEIQKLNAQAALLEMDINKETWEKNYEAAKDEMATIVKLMEELEPQRKYKHLPDSEAHEAMQREEWLYEFMTRAENYILSEGTIPQDQLQAMRSHPDFETRILPHIVGIYEKIEKITKDKDRFTVLGKNKEQITLGGSYDNVRKIAK